MTSPEVNQLKRVFFVPRLRILLLTTGLAILGGAVWYGINYKGKANLESPLPQAVGIQLSEIVALGRLQPEGGIISVAGPQGSRIAKLQVAEGESIQKSQILAYLDSYQEQLMQRDLAASQVDEIKQRVAIDTRLQATEIDQAQTQVVQIDVPQALQIQSQEALVRRFSAELREAEQVRDRFLYLTKAGATSQHELDAKELAVRQARESLEQAEATVAQLTESRTANLQAAKMNTRRSQVALEQVQSHSGLLSANRNLALAEVKLQRTIIRSPRAGQILKIFAHEGEAITNQGVLQIGTTQQMEVIAEVYEADIKQVQVGQSAIVTHALLPKPLMGKVVQLGRMVYKNDLIGDDPAAARDARVVEVRIRLDHSQPVANLSNLQVTVRIQPAPSGSTYGSS